ncbi:hypothetical protein ACQX5F_11215, partial [Corynebacterium diphtheriae]
RATKRGYFEGFFSELHTKSQENRSFDWIWCEVPPFSGVIGGGAPTTEIPRMQLLGINTR